MFGERLRSSGPSDQKGEFSPVQMDPISEGEVPEWSNGAVSKTVVPLTRDRGFESHPLRYVLRLHLKKP